MLQDGRRWHLDGERIAQDFEDELQGTAQDLQDAARGVAPGKARPRATEGGSESLAQPAFWVQGGGTREGGTSNSNSNLTRLLTHKGSADSTGNNRGGQFFYVFLLRSRPMLARDDFDK